MTDKIIEILYKRLAGGKLSPGESDFLDEWIAENPSTRRAFVENLADTGKIADEYRLREMIDTDRPLADMQHRLGLDVAMRKTLRWRPWAAAACVAVLAAGAFVWLSPDDNHSAEMVADAPTRELRLDEMTPGASMAVVTLADGDTVHLSGNSEIVLAEVAKASGAKAEDLKVEVPRGGEFVVVLEDSTRVWLNSASTLVYPASFSDSERVVSLQGEAYFDVSKSAGRPFKVETAGQRVTVYGTEFNVRSYEEDDAVYTTLSKGKVALSRLDGAGGEIFLSPGKQAVFDKETFEANVRSVDIETVTGWRHGRFVFEEQSLMQIMRDLSRWYDFDFEFKDRDVASTVFMGSIPRYSNFKTAIAILEKSGNLKFEIKDNKILISRNAQ